jgi:Haloacid dehalogenase-like hydrolase
LQSEAVSEGEGVVTHIKAKRCKLVLASSCSDNEVDQFKAIAGITDMTDHDVTADDAGTSKPAPDIFLNALDRLAPIKPSETCVIGDTKYDGEAAHAADIPFLGLLCGALLKKIWTGRERLRFIAILPICSSIPAAGWTCPPSANSRARPVNLGAGMPDLLRILLPVYDNAPPVHRQ